MSTTRAPRLLLAAVACQIAVSGGMGVARAEEPHRRIAPPERTERPPGVRHQQPAPAASGILRRNNDARYIRPDQLRRGIVVPPPRGSRRPPPVRAPREPAPPPPR